MKYANRLATIEPFYVVDVLTRAKLLERQGVDVVQMVAGEPDFPTIDPIVDAAKKALTEGKTYYTEALGLLPLREKISELYQTRYNVKVPVDRIVITPGASGALQLTALTLLNPGDGVMLADPGYPSNRQFIRLAGGEPQLVPVSFEDNYQLTGELVDKYWQANTRAAQVATPSNPTGSVLNFDELTALHHAVTQKSGHLIVDELYHGLHFDEPCDTVLSITDSAFVINSFSKYFGMTGWRLGWMVVPEDAVPHIEKLSQNMFISLSTPAQYGALAGFTEESTLLLDQRRDVFKQRKAFLIKALREIGFEIPIEPKGAFYLYASAKKFTDDSFGFCHELLDKAHVSVTPGKDFGDYLSNEHVRFSFTTSMESLEKGVERLARFLR